MCATVLMKGQAGEQTRAAHAEGLAQEGCSQESQESCVGTAPLEPYIP